MENHITLNSIIIFGLKPMTAKNSSLSYPALGIPSTGSGKKGNAQMNMLFRPIVFVLLIELKVIYRK
ncbi:MAG: hypothetical protein Q8L90_03980 [Bacteroidota bacterium]|nr:hypothetical protein [Bacteroidota bacterium]